MKLTYFTPAYNAQETLPSLYDSLCNQTVKDFEWIVVNDGSKDETSDLIKMYMSKSKFSIYLYEQENGGKHRAYNRAIMECKTDLLCCVDADIVLRENATEVILEEWDKYSDNAEIAGIVTPLYCKNSMQSLETKQEYKGFSDRVPETGRMPELYSKYHYSGETMYPYRVSVLKKYLFPDIPGEKFMTESTMFLPISKKYKVHWVNKCLGESFYLSGGLTDRRFYHQANSPISTLLFYKICASCQINFFGRATGCGCYYAWKKVFKVIENESFDRYRISIIEKIVGFMLTPHYVKLFRGNLKKLKD